LSDKVTDAIASPSPIERGTLQRTQGYCSGMLVHESRILQVTIFGMTIFGTLHTHLTALDFDALLPDVMILADEVDAQLTRTMEAFAKAGPKSTAA
jgi:hypothetical protein